MENEIETMGEWTIVTVQEDALDARSAKSFRDELTTLVSDKTMILLDMSHVEFVDSAGLGTIVATLKQLRSNDGDLSICCVQKSVRALFELVRMHRLVDVYATRNDVPTSVAG